MYPRTCLLSLGRVFSCLYPCRYRLLVVEEVVVVVDNADYTIVRVDFVGGQSRTYCLANRNPEGAHKVKAGGKTYKWNGVWAVE